MGWYRVRNSYYGDGYHWDVARDRPRGAPFPAMSALRTRVGKTVRRLRTQAGYSQEGLAAACKFHRTYIGAIERGEKNITLDAIERIARTLKVDPAELFRDAATDSK